MTNNYHQNTKRNFEKKHVKDIKIFLKKKKKRSPSIVTKDIRIFWRTSTEKNFLECRK